MFFSGSVVLATCWAIFKLLMLVFEIVRLIVEFALSGTSTLPKKNGKPCSPAATPFKASKDVVTYASALTSSMEPKSQAKTKNPSQARAPTSNSSSRLGKGAQAEHVNHASSAAGSGVSTAAPMAPSRAPASGPSSGSSSTFHEHAARQIPASITLTTPAMETGSASDGLEMAPLPQYSAASGMTLFTGTQPLTFYAAAPGAVGVGPSLYTTPQPPTLSYTFSPVNAFTNGPAGSAIYPASMGQGSPFQQGSLPLSKSCAHMVGVVQSASLPEYIPMDSSHHNIVAASMSPRFCLSTNHGILPASNPAQVIFTPIAPVSTAPGPSNGSSRCCHHCTLVQGHQGHTTLQAGDKDQSSRGAKIQSNEICSSTSTSHSINGPPPLSETGPASGYLAQKQHGSSTVNVITKGPSTSMAGVNYLYPPQPCRAIVHSSSPPSCCSSNSPSPGSSPKPIPNGVNPSCAASIYSPIPYSAPLVHSGFIGSNNSASSNETSQMTIPTSQQFVLYPVQKSSQSITSSTQPNSVTTLTASVPQPVVTSSKQYHSSANGSLTPHCVVQTKPSPTLIHFSEAFPSIGSQKPSHHSSETAVTSSLQENKGQTVVTTTVVCSQQVQILSPPSIAYPQHLPQHLFIHQHPPAISSMIPPPVGGPSGM
jgi:hypothetical protein